MNSATISIVLIAFLFAVVASAPQQGRPEDSEPVIDVTTCGGEIDESSASIQFQLGGSIRADMRCVWILRASYETQRFNLVSSGLKETDGIYINRETTAGLGGALKLSTIGQNVTTNSKNVLITLVVGHAPTLGFKLEYYSSGYSVTRDMTGSEILTAAKGNFSYPVGGGNYANYENAVFAIAPSVPGQPTVRFTRVDLEAQTSCSYDWVKIFNWFEGDYVQVSRFCGTTIPTSVTFQDGAGVIQFVSDATIPLTGFDFEWE